MANFSGRVSARCGRTFAGATHLQFRVSRCVSEGIVIVQIFLSSGRSTALYQFTDHDGFDGVMLGHKDAGYHLEFTHKGNHYSGKAPTQENLLVFYLPGREVWQHAVKRLEDHGYESIRSFNPYWDQRGKTFEDPDGYRVVLQNASWAP